jgi:hypothetical protein
MYRRRVNIRTLPGFKVAVTRQAEPNNYPGHFPNKDPRIFFGAFPFFEKQDAYRDL